MHAILGVTLVLLSLSASLSSARAGDLDPRFECDDYRVGAGVKKDYAQAFECFEKRGDVEGQLLMLLNGEGPGARWNKKSIDALLAKHRAQKDPRFEDDVLAGYFKDVDWSKPKSETPGAEKIAYCRDGGSNTIEMNACAGYELETESRRNSNEGLAVLKGATASQQKKYLALKKAMDAFADAASGAAYQDNIEGTIRGMAAIGEEAGQKKIFWHLFMRTVKEKHLVPASDAEVKRADQALNKAYFAAKPGAPLSKEDLAQGMKPAAEKTRLEAHRKAQRLWLPYRDDWVAFAQDWLQGKEDPQAVKRSLLLALTEWRTIDFADPVGVSPDQGEAHDAAVAKLRNKDLQP